MNEAVSVRELRFTYADPPTPALRGVSFTQAVGELTVVMGRSGAGKSTLVKALSRIVPTFHGGQLEGEIKLFGRPLRAETVADLAGLVGTVFQDFEAQLFSTNVLQEIAFGMEQLGVAPAEMASRVHAVLVQVGLEGFEGRDPSTLSGGEKQRLAIASLLALAPRLMLFDEPTTDLDPVGKTEVIGVLERMRTEGHTLLVVEHDIDAAVAADRIVLLDAGRVVAAGAPGRLLRDAALWQRHGVRPRDMARLAAGLGLDPPPLTVDDAEALLREAGRVPKAPRPRASTARVPLIELEGVSYTYPGGAEAVRGMTTRIGQGEFVAIIGQNGSGKSTLARLLNGLLRPTRGRVRIDGVEVSGQPLERMAGKVGYVFQDPDHQLFSATVEDEVAFGPRNLGLGRVEAAARAARALAAVGLEAARDADPFLLRKGERQRLAVAAVLALEPEVVILDEPTTGLDYDEQRRILALLQALRAAGRTIVVITHSPWVVAEHAERGLLMSEGMLLFDGPLRRLFEEQALLERAHFRVPEITALGRRFGVTPLSVDEFLTWLGAAGVSRCH